MTILMLVAAGVVVAFATGLAIGALLTVWVMESILSQIEPETGE